MQTSNKNSTSFVNKKFRKTNPRKSDTGTTIYIGNLSYKRDEKGIKWLFSEFGKVNSLEIITDNDTNKNKGYAFVKMYNSIEALKAVKELNGKIIDGRTLKVSIAKNRSFDKTSYFKKEEDALRKGKSIEVSNKKDKILKNRQNRKPKGLDVLKEYLSR